MTSAPDADAFRRLEAALASAGAKPPIHLWDPELSGDIDIEIAADGRWYHEGTEFKRPALVRLFASILRRESDGHHYLVTPVEKWRIRVVNHALRIIDYECSGTASPQVIAVLNTGESILLGEDYPLAVLPPSPDSEPQPVVQIWHGLSALIERSVWYRLIEEGTAQDGRLLLLSNDCQFDLGALE